MKIVVRYCDPVRNAVLHISNQKGNPRFQEEIAKLLEFIQKYDVKIG